jgi:hypothetical protein
MDASPRRPAGPFLFSGAVVAVVCVAMARLPESFIAVFERSRPLNDAQAGWAYRLLVLASILQAAYGGFVILRVETIRRARQQDRKVATTPKERLVTSVARNAAFMVSLTLVYGLAAFWITGERGGFWLFPLLAAAQLAWYYRQVGQIASWLSFQPAVEPDGPSHVWQREPPDYCPPLARGLTPRS